VTFVVQFLPLLVYSIWMVRRLTKMTSAPKPVRRPTAGTTAAVGLEDDTAQWHAWTALDEHQLIRLLSDSAPRHRSAPNPTDNVVPQAQREDTP